jgi:hypothetical protein
MKKQIILLALTAAVALFFSCKKTEGSTAPQNRGIEESKPVAESSAFKQGYALRVNTGFYVLDGEDNGEATTKTKWDSGIVLGESVTTGKTRKMIFSGDNKEYSFIEIRNYNKKEGFALINQIAVGGRLAVVVEEKANLFSAPKTVNVTNRTVSQKTVLVYFPETESGSFVEIKGIDGESKNTIAEGQYMRLSSISRSDSDIQSSILLQTAQTMINSSQAVAKEALLKSALQDYPNSVFYSEIREILYPGIGNADPVYPISDYDDD